MNDLLVKYAGYKVSEVPPHELRNLITDMIKDADFTMSAKIDADYEGALVGWTYKFLNNRYSQMPISHVNAAFEQGSMGHRGGTSKLMPRNIAIWISLQNDVLQEQLARVQRNIDEDRRAKDFEYNQSAGFVATAVRMKVHWLADGLINSKQYNSFSSQLICDLLMKGYKEKEIHPRMILPDYDETL